MEQVLQSVDLVLNTVWARLAFGVAVVAVLVIGVVLLVQWKHQCTRLAMVFGKAADPSFYAHIDTVTHAFDQQTATQNEAWAAVRRHGSPCRCVRRTMDPQPCQTPSP